MAPRMWLKQSWFQVSSATSGATKCNKCFGVIVAPRMWLKQSWCQVVLHMWCHHVHRIYKCDCGTKIVAQAIVVPSCLAHVVPSFINRLWLQSWQQLWHQVLSTDRGFSRGDNRGTNHRCGIRSARSGAKSRLWQWPISASVQLQRLFAEK